MTKSKEQTLTALWSCNFSMFLNCKSNFFYPCYDDELCKKLSLFSLTNISVLKRSYDERVHFFQLWTPLARVALKTVCIWTSLQVYLYQLYVWREKANTSERWAYPTRICWYLEQSLSKTNQKKGRRKEKKKRGGGNKKEIDRNRDTLKIQILQDSLLKIPYNNTVWEICKKFSDKLL